jgi:hypothetical protein
MFGSADTNDAGVLDLRTGGKDKSGFFSGNSARRLLERGPTALRTNTTLLYDEWKLFDNTVMQIARERLVLATELLRRGLRYPLPDALGVLQLMWQRMGDINDAELTMTGLPEADKDHPDFDLLSMPVPMIHKEFTYDLRYLRMTRRNGQQIDTVHGEIAARKVMEKIEGLILSGASIATNLGNIYGLLNQPQRNTGGVSANWATAATGEQMVADVTAMITAAYADHMYGPYLLFVPTAVYIRMSEDYKVNGDLTILQRLMQIPGLDGILPSERLTGTTILLVQMTSDVLQLVDGIQPTMVEWDGRGGFELNFMIFAIMLPRVRADYNGQSGIVHFS